MVNTVIVLAKSFSRYQLAKLPFWWDDFWVVLAWLLLMPICALGLAMVHVETSWDAEDRMIVDLDEAEILLKIIYALLQFLCASFAATRYAILALHLRLFVGSKLRIAIWAVAAFVTMQWIGFGLQSFFQCHPVEYFWNRRTEAMSTGSTAPSRHSSV